MEVVGKVAAVEQLVGYVVGLIFKIKRAADTAKQNKRECDYLVLHLSNIDEKLRDLPQDPEVARLLVQLGSTLKEAHGTRIFWRNRFLPVTNRPLIQALAIRAGKQAHALVIACQKPDIFKIRKLFRASTYAERFREVNARITSDLSLFPMASYTALARRLDQIILHAQQDCARMAKASSSSSSGSVKTQMVSSHVSLVSDDQPRELTWAEISTATNNLVAELGGGRSGTVYKGSLHHHGRAREVAVKVLKYGRQGKEVSFMAEVEILFPLRHDHIVSLVGWCLQEERRTFVYEHMSNGTLRDHLLGLGGRGGGGSPVVSSWRSRFEVLLGSARALQHLHRHPTRPVIHRNVSSSNILLDASWASRLSDFGQALLVAAGDEHGGQSQLVPEAIGTFGYLDKEYCCTRRVSPASDVYSFGVVTLEVLTGRPHVSSSEGNSAEVPVTLVSSVLQVIQNGKLRDVLDGRPALVPTPPQLEALELVANTAVLCLWPQGKDRPAISSVVANLETALGIILSDETNQL